MAGQGRRVQRCSAAVGTSRSLAPGEGAAGRPSQPRTSGALPFTARRERRHGVGPGPERVGILIYSPSSGEHPRAVQGWAEEEHGSSRPIPPGEGVVGQERVHGSTVVAVRAGSDARER